MSARAIFRTAILVVAMLLVARRAPAPIRDIATPTPAETATPVATPTPKAKPRAAAPKKPRAAARATAEPQTKAPAAARGIDGTWLGSISTIGAGNVEFVLVISGNGTVTKETSTNFGTAVHGGTSDGRTARWRSGPNNVYSWTFTPNPDGATAIVTVTGPFIANPLSAFRRK
jgi:hypothetical protein